MTAWRSASSPPTIIRPRHHRGVSAAVSERDRGAVRSGAAADARDGRAEDGHGGAGRHEDPRQRQPAQRAFLRARGQDRSAVEGRARRTFARGCGLAARWSTPIASRSTRFPNGSRSTSTTRSTRSTASSNCGRSTPTTTNTDFSRSSSSTARAASSRPCFVLPNDRAARRSSPFSAGCCAHDGHCCGPEVLDWCRATGLDYILGVAPTTTLRRHVADLEASTKARSEAAPRDGKLRRFKEVFDGAQSWSRVERIIARVEVGEDGPDTRFVVTNLRQRNARRLYEDVYCRRGQAENHIKSWKTHLAADRTSCTKATANQFRLFLHAGAYWLMWGLRVSMPKRSMWRVAQFDTLRLRHQDRRPRRRNEDDDPGALADLMPGAGYSAPRPGTRTAPRQLSDGARGPKTQTHPVNPQTASNPNSGSKPVPSQHVQTLPNSSHSPPKSRQHRHSAA